MVTDALSKGRGCGRRAFLSATAATALLLTLSTTLVPSCAASIKTPSFERTLFSNTCPFNPSCLCSLTAGMQLGVVRCVDVPLQRTPKALNSSKIVMLQLDNNGLRKLDDRFAFNTGIMRLDVSRNLLTELSDDVLNGLSKSLNVLELRFNKLSVVPLRALLHLQKLYTLDLTGNEISELPTEPWRGVEKTLTTLILARNSIWSLPGPGTFNSLEVLETLDLSGNSLASIDANMLFSTSAPSLHNLFLADNQLRWIPYDTLRNFRQLHILDLSSNLLTTMEESPAANAEQPMRLTLEALHLQNNFIRIIKTESFRHFEFINKTYFDGNPIEELQEKAFRPARLRELWLRDGNIWTIHPDTFFGQENTLQLIDLSANNITLLPPNLLRNLRELRTFSIRDNHLTLLEFDQVIGENENLRRSFERLDFGGRNNPVVHFKDFRGMDKLSFLSLSRIPQLEVGPLDLEGVGEDLQELHLNDGRLAGLRNHAFRFARGLKHLDLTDSNIKSIESEAFKEVGKSLLTLRMSRALSGSMKTAPAEAFRPLESLKVMDLSHNRLRTVPEYTFAHNDDLVKVLLRDNEITAILRGTFQEEKHKKLEEIDVSFNEITKIPTHTFEGLEKLTRLSLDDNQINHIEKGSFSSLNNLKYLGLRGNKLSRLDDESFQNIHELEELDLAYNRINNLDFAMFDQAVGTMARALKVNMSYNQLTHLEPNASLGRNYASVKILDLSHNNISSIGRYFFAPVESLTHLYFSFNWLHNATKDVFGDMPELVLIDLSANQLHEIHHDTFRNTDKLQVILLARNQLTDVPAELFRNMINLRIVDLSHNRLRTLPDGLLPEEGPEWLDLSHNQFLRLPFSCISGAAAGTLRHWDLSHNNLMALHSQETSFSRFRALEFLDLSYNRLTRLEGSVFSDLPRLIELDVSHNPELQLDNRGASFRGLSDTLRTLRLANISQDVMPDVALQFLLDLSVAHNKISSVPTDLASNFSSLRSLDLSFNELTQIPLAIQSLPNLRRLNLAGNPLHQLGNTSLLGGVERIRQLDLRWLPLTHFEPGALSKMVALTSLYISTYREVRDFRIPIRIQDNTALRRLFIEVDDEGEDLEGEMRGFVPDKLSWLTLSGRRLRSVPMDLFKGFRTPRLQFTLRNTSVESLPYQLWYSLQHTRNLTLDVRNNSLRIMANPNMAQRPDQTGMFLNSLQMAGNHWSCDCDLGWVEVWRRKQRQYYCPQPSRQARPPPALDSRDFLYFEHNVDCSDHRDDDLREAQCANRHHRPVLEVFKEEVECGWGAASRPGSTAPLIVVAATVAALLAAKMTGV